MSLLAILCTILIVAVIVLGVALYLAIRRRNVIPEGQPTAEEANIANVFALQKKELTDSTPSGADVRRMSDEELENIVNRRRTE